MPWTIYEFAARIVIVIDHSAGDDGWRTYCQGSLTDVRVCMSSNANTHTQNILVIGRVVISQIDRSPGALRWHGGGRETLNCANGMLVVVVDGQKTDGMSRHDTFRPGISLPQTWPSPGPSPGHCARQLSITTLRPGHHQQSPSPAARQSLFILFAYACVSRSNKINKIWIYTSQPEKEERMGQIFKSILCEEGTRRA